MNDDTDDTLLLVLVQIASERRNCLWVILKVKLKNTEKSRNDAKSRLHELYAAFYAGKPIPYVVRDLILYQIWR